MFNQRRAINIILTIYLPKTCGQLSDKVPVNDVYKQEWSL